MPTITLPAIFDLGAATQLAEDLRLASPPVTIDASAVERVGIPGLQLLLSLHRSGDPVAIDTPSDALRAAARTAALEFLFAAQA